MHKPSHVAAAALIVGVIAVRSEAGGVLHVDDDAPAGGDGLSWDTAYRFLQDALSHAADSAGAVTEIRVAQGVYHPGLPGPESCCFAHGGPGCDDAGCETHVCSIVPSCCDTAWTDECAELARDDCREDCPSPFMPSFELVDGVSVRGAFAGPGAPDPDERDVALYPTVLTGDTLGNDLPWDYWSRFDNSSHVVRASGAKAAVLDGLTITGGLETFELGGAGLFSEGADVTLIECTIAGNRVLGGPAGGIRNVGGSLTLTGCAVEANQSNDNGGGIWSNGDLVLVDCVLSANEVGGTSNGGAVECLGGALTVLGCEFVDNYADVGGAINGWDASMFVAGSSFIDNSAGQGAGAVFGDVTATGCLFLGNSAYYSGGAFAGSGSFFNCRFENNRATGCCGPANAVEGAVTLVGCVVVANRGTAEEGAVSGPATLINCTMSGNGGAVGSWSRPATLINCIVWDDSVWNATVMFSDVQGGWPGAGNIDADPLFADPGAGDYRLLPGSPCIDAGHNWGTAKDAADLDGDGDTEELTPVDLGGNPRFVAGSKEPIGCGTPVVVDMGAYEFQERGGASAAIVLGDIDGNGAVGITDLLEVLAAWGEAGDQCELSDLDLDGQVGHGDLLILLDRWR